MTGPGLIGPPKRRGCAMTYVTLAEMTARRPAAGIEMRVLHGERMSFAHFTFTPGTPLPEHRHPHEQIGTVVKGEMELTIAGETRVVAAGGPLPHPPLRPLHQRPRRGDRGLQPGARGLARFLSRPPSPPERPVEAMHAVSASPKDIFRRSPQRIYCFADTPELCRVRTVEDALLIVNDRVEIAREVGADGIHVGQEDLDCREVVRRVPPAMIVGVSARTPDLARRAAAAGATYVGAGAVFATATKPEAEVIGLKGLSAVAASVEIPVVAIGGITLEAVRPVLAAGARYCAVISGINDAPDPALALARFLAAAAALPPDQQP